MKKRFSDEQIISILREAEAGVSARELCRKHAISDASFTPGVCVALKQMSLRGAEWSKMGRLSEVTPDVQSENNGDPFVAKPRTNDFSTQGNNKYPPLPERQ